MRPRAALAIRLLGLGGIALVLPAMGAWAIVWTLSRPPNPCRMPDAPLHGPIDQHLIIAACAASFLAGHFAGYLRDASRDPKQRGRGPGAMLVEPVTGRRRTPTRTDILVQLLATLFLLLATLLLVYETWSLWRYPALAPITSYVRCVNVIAPGQTLAASCAASFLIGHWLWHPGSRR